VLTGLAPTVALPVAVQAGLGALVLTGFAPTVQVTVTANPGTGSLVLTGLAPTVTATANQRVLADVGQLTLTGLAPTVAVTGAAPAADPYAYFPGDTFGSRGKRYEEYSEEHPEQPKPKKARKRKKAEPTPLPPLPVPAPEPVTAVPVAQPVVIQSPPLVTYVAPPRRLWTLQPITASASASVTVGSHARIEPWMLYDVLDPQEDADEEAIILALLR
jgi:hypothetical protein